MLVGERIRGAMIGRPTTEQGLADAARGKTLRPSFSERRSRVRDDTQHDACHSGRGEAAEAASTGFGPGSGIGLRPFGMAGLCSEAAKPYRASAGRIAGGFTFSSGVSAAAP